MRKFRELQTNVQGRQRDVLAPPILENGHQALGRSIKGLQAAGMPFQLCVIFPHVLTPWLLGSSRQSVILCSMAAFAPFLSSPMISKGITLLVATFPSWTPFAPLPTAFEPVLSVPI